MSDALRNWVREREPALVALLTNLVAIDSTTGREDELAHFCAAWLEGHGLAATLQPCKGRHNVLGTVGSGEPALVISGHLDTVPAEASAWSRAPHDVVVEDGKLYGLGASDLKVSIAGAYFAQLFLHEEGSEHGFSPDAMRVVTAFTIEEETTGDGTRLFLEQALAEGLLDPARAAAIITEPTGLSELCVANAGTIFVELELTGRGGHGSRPHQACNPIPELGALLGGLPELATRWAAAYGDSTFTELARPTLTPTAIEAGDPVRQNVIPVRARAVLDVRVPRALYADDFALFRREFEAFVALQRERLARVGATLAWRVRNGREGHRLDPEHPLVRTALRVLREELGLATEVRATTAGNDAVYFGLAGIPALNKVGPGHPECAHRADEFVRIESLLLGTEFFVRMALAWARESAR